MIGEPNPNSRHYPWKRIGFVCRECRCSLVYLMGIDATREQAERSLRIDGWKQVGKWGWVCRQCSSRWEE